MTDHLFDPPEPISTPPDEMAGLSATRRLTLRNNNLLAQGTHPATGRQLANNGETCGTCEHCNRYQYHNGNYIKCERHRLGESHSASSDIRASWPACQLWFPQTEVLDE